MQTKLQPSASLSQLKAQKLLIQASIREQMAEMIAVGGQIREMEAQGARATRRRTQTKLG